MSAPCPPAFPVVPALLITHGCVLDKKTRSGALTIERLHFLQLQNVAAQDANKRALLRSKARTIEPSEVLYVGDVPGLGFEAFVVLSEPVTVPAQRFRPTLVDVPGDGGDVVDRRFAGDGGGHDRVARLSDRHVELLKDKMNAFWTRRTPDRTAAGAPVAEETRH